MSHKELEAILKDNNHANEKEWREQKWRKKNNKMTHKKRVLDCHFDITEWQRAAYRYKDICVTLQSPNLCLQVCVCMWLPLCVILKSLLSI